jgi:NAD(P)H-hydrate epimerase
VIDALLGSGLNRPVTGVTASLIRHINHSSAEVIAIDTPSGLFADKANAPDDAVIHAQHTLSFEVPRLAFLFDENYTYTGDWHRLSIGIHPWYVRDVETKIFRTDFASMSDSLKSRKRVAHKGTFGHALLIGGSYGRMGAALLAGGAALRSGAGLLTVCVPKCGFLPFQTALPEAMVWTDDNEKFITDFPENVADFDAVGVGHGLGQQDESFLALKKLLKNYTKPMVIDADALNIIARNPDLLSEIPPHSIITPHKKEFERLFGVSQNPFERWQKQLKISAELNINIVFKGANTCITLPDGRTYFNGTGNPGMATAGSGDVLTGLLTGLLAQGYEPAQAAIFGVFLHGLAGDLAASKLSQEAMLAGDMVRMFGKAFRVING